MNEDEIMQVLRDGLKDTNVDIIVDGSHLTLKLVSDVFHGLSRLKRQRLVNSLLSEKIASGEIHAVNMTCLTLEEVRNQDKKIG